MPWHLFKMFYVYTTHTKDLIKKRKGNSQTFPRTHKKIFIHWSLSTKKVYILAHCTSVNMQIQLLKTSHAEEAWKLHGKFLHVKGEMDLIFATYNPLYLLLEL